MNNNSELVFRITVGVVTAIWIASRLYFQREVGGGEKIFERHGRREMVSYMLINFSFFPIFLYVFAGLFGFAHFVIPDWVRWAGLAISLSGSMLFFWTHLALGKNWSGVLEIAKGHELVINGPYRFIRHPMYSACFLIGIGVLLLSANWMVGGISLAAFGYMYVVRVADEEAMMIDQFGRNYEAYMTTTGRLFPRLLK